MDFVKHHLGKQEHEQRRRRVKSSHVALLVVRERFPCFSSISHAEAKLTTGYDLGCSLQNDADSASTCIGGSTVPGAWTRIFGQPVDETGLALFRCHSSQGQAELVP